MLDAQQSLVAGNPTFGDASLAAVADSQGPLAAWQQALQRLAPEQAAAQAHGSFSVALQLAGGRAFAAVDRFARRTLCYRLVDGGVRFALRADQLVAGATGGLDPQALHDYLLLHAIPSPQTVFAGVHRLPPGHYAWFDGTRLTVAPYWTPEFTEDRSSRFEDLRAEFLRLLRQAVKRQLDGSPPACFLSGGTDSSTVAGLMAEVSPAPHSYSIGFDAEGYDEMSYARIAAQRFGTRHHEYYVTPDDLVRTIPQVAASFDQPFGNSSAVPAYLCTLRAREDGVTRLLAGDGGDELFGGNSRYAKQRLFDAYQSVPGGLRRGVLEPLLSPPSMQRMPLLRKAASYVEQARVPMPDRLEMYNLLLRLGPKEVLTPGFLALVDPGAAGRQQRQVWAAPEQAGLLNRALAYDWRYTLAESDLPKVRGAAELAGVEVAFPLLDDDLLEFSMRLRDSHKLKGLKLRWFFKEALRGLLPDEIIAKQKHGFGLPFGVWATQHAALREMAADALHGTVRRGLVREPFVTTLLDTHLQQHPGYYGEMVWVLMMLEHWLRAHAPQWRVAA